MVSTWRIAEALLAMMSTLAKAGHAVLEGQEHHAVLDHGGEMARDHAPQQVDVREATRQRKLVRSERPIWKYAPARREDSFQGRFPDDDNSDSSASDPYAADPASTQHSPAVQPEDPNNAGQDASASVEVRQEVNGSTPSGFIDVGTPAKKLYVIMDTGSDKLVAKTWSTIQKELRTVDGGIDDAVKPSATVYNRDTSSTYVRLYSNGSGDAMGMQDLHAPAAAKDGKKMPKQGFIAYGSGVAITEEGQDTVKVGSRDLVQFPISEIAQDSLSMLHTKQGIAGILGLQHMKNGSMGESVFTRARSSGRMYSFSYCRGDNNDGTFIWGDQATDGQKIDVLGQIHWAVNLAKVKMVSTAAAAPSPKPAPPPEDHSDPGDFQTSRKEDVHPHHSHSPFSPFQPSVGDAGFGGDGRNEQPIYPWFRSSLAQKSDPETDTTSSGALNDPELKEEIGKMVGDIIGKVVEKIENKKAHTGDSHTDDEQNAAEVSSNVFCGENDKCTAILDTGSNIIAGPSDGIKELTKFAKVSPDCSNFDKLPHLHLHLGDDFKVDLPPKAYVMQVKLPKWAAGGAGGAGGEGFGDGSGDPMGDMGGEGGEPGAGGGEDGMDGMDGLEGMDGGMLGFSRHRSKKVRAWYKIVKALYANRGVDLSAAFRGINIRDLLHNDQLCMPAFVPLDKKTTVGKLWVVGTPLFEQYYTRWSWGKDEAAPSVFLTDKHTAKACVGTAAQGSSPTSGSNSADAKESSRLLRHERVGKPIQLLDKSTEGQSSAQRPPLMDITDIRYPHWAKTLSGV